MNPEKAAEVVEKDGDTQPHAKKAIVISILALTLAFASLGSTKTTKILTVNNIQISNTQTIYEFRILRQLVLSTTVDLLSSELADAGSNKSANISAKSAKSMNEIIGRYEKQIQSIEKDDGRDDDKQDLQAKLNDLKDIIHNAKAKNERFEYAEAALQIAIVLVSASIIATGAFLFWGGVGLGLIGLILTINGYWLFF